MADSTPRLIATLFVALNSAVPQEGDECVIAANGIRGRLARIVFEACDARDEATRDRRPHRSELASIELELSAPDVIDLMPGGRARSVELWNAESWDARLASAESSAGNAGLPAACGPFAAGLIVAVRSEMADESSTPMPVSRGLTIWLTGLSGAGKTTIADELKRVFERHGRVESLDADVVRTHLCKGLGFSEEDRRENVRRLAVIARLLAETGAVVLVSAISPYRSMRDQARQRIGRFVEVYVNAPLSVCEGRDVKGLYKRARSGEIHSFTGIDDPYESPLDPEIECRTDLETIAESVAKIVTAVARYYDFPEEAVEPAIGGAIQQVG